MAIHIIHFTAPINSATCGQLIDKASQAAQQNAERLVLNIATMGGECSYGFTLYNFLLSLPMPVHTHNLGTVESMGNVIFLAGEHRTACPHSKFLFHPFHWHLNGAVDHSRMSEYAMSLDFDMHLYCRIVAERTQGAQEPLETEKYLTAAPRILEPEQALLCGVIHEVQSPLQKGEYVTHCVHS
ncbi:ATP-dependent Clp protease proteolytic subunit [uncultured Pseudomonas sp.]|uniref:ATP-dependent Clp protease proteolytic subunit n=1 Tax=uncultured Pseudomonas sp. TaxID=114707 RepID=UPI0025E1D004|nr:ATP-dependent Clp protease proteolytic subunit [uncultured Pseudomonas sp.]